MDRHFLFLINRRTFLKFAGSFGMFSLVSPSFGYLFVDKMISRIKNLFTTPAEIPPDHERAMAKLPDEGKTISVEMALNSRCNSDSDGNPKRFHWGMFDTEKKLSDAQIERIIHLARIPRFTDRRVEIQSERNMLTFVIDNRASGLLRDRMMVESGMQQQAIGLICAAMGAGMVFNSLGDDGAAISGTDYATIKIKLNPVRPSYNGSFWTSQPPTDTKPWLQGNLPDPERNGDKALIDTLLSLKIQRRNSKKSTKHDVSQLLWAARGRTPHYYKSRPWGMTIPVSRGDQNISSVYFIKHDQLFEYINWDKKRPSHSLKGLGKINLDDQESLIEFFTLNSRNYIILGKNENSGRAYWEIGYQLLNILLQAQASGLSYKSILLNKAQKDIFKKVGIKDPVAAFSLM